MSDRYVNYTCFHPPASPDTKLEQGHYQWIQSIEELEEILDKAPNVVAFDCETTGLDFVKHHMVGFSFSYSAYDGYYVAIRHTRGDDTTNLDPKQALQLFYDKVLTQKKVLMYNALFEFFMLQKEGFDVTPIKFFDCMILVFNADANTPKKDLKWASSHYLGREVPTFKETLGRLAHFGEVHPEDCYLYATYDTANTYGLYKVLLPKLLKEGCKRIIKIDQDLVRAMFFYQQQEITIDTEVMQDLYEELKHKLQELQKEIFSIVGYPFSIDCLTQETFVNVFYRLKIKRGAKSQFKGLIPIVQVKDLLSKRIFKGYALTYKVEDLEVETPFGWYPIERYFDVGEKEVYEVHFENRVVRCSGNELFMIKHDERLFYVRAKDLRENDDVVEAPVSQSFEEIPIC